MKEFEAILFDLLQDKKKRLYLIAGTALALLLICILLATLLGGSGRKFNRYYNEAEEAYQAGDYAAAEEKLRRAMDLKSNEKAYLLMADIYCAQGDADRAIQILYLGYSHVGGARIEKRLDELKSGRGGGSPLPVQKENVTIDGKTVDGSVTSLVLTGTRLRNDDTAALASLVRMENLGLSDCGIKDIGFLSGLKELTFLQISDNSVRDLSPIAEMKHLKTLYIDNNPIEDLTPLYGLSALRTLSMKGIPLSQRQLDALREALPNCSVYADEPETEVREIRIGGRNFRSDVTELSLGGLKITDISALSACTNLEKLDLRDNEIKDISPLVELPKLKWLCVWNNQIEDINPLLSLSGLEYIDADSNRISDISVLEFLPHLKEVWLNKNPLKSVEPLRALTELTKLGLAGTGLDDDGLECLMELKTLTELNIKDNKSLSARKVEALKEALPKCEISHDELRYTVRFGDREYTSDCEELDAAWTYADDLTGLEDFTSLRILKLNGNRITDLSPLRELSKLEELWLNSGTVSDLAPLSGLNKLTTLMLQDNAVKNLTPLVGCSSLKKLDLSGNGLSDISALAYLSGLTWLELSDNSIRDLSALYSLTSLRTLNLSGNPLSEDDIQALRTMLPECSIVFNESGPTRPSGPSSGSDLR